MRLTKKIEKYNTDQNQGERIPKIEAGKYRFKKTTF